jgi:hypothetical protein
MPYQNISVTLPAPDVTTIKNGITAIEVLLPFRVNLSDAERKSLPKTGLGRVGFVQQALAYAKDHPEILPPSFNTAEFEKDVVLFTQLTEILALLKGLTNGVDDTTLGVGSEAMRAALHFYELLKTAAKNNPGLQPLVDELARTFKRTSPPEPGPTPTP